MSAHRRLSRRRPVQLNPNSLSAHCGLGSLRPLLKCPAFPSGLKGRPNWVGHSSDFDGRRLTGPGSDYATRGFAGEVAFDNLKTKTHASPVGTSDSRPTVYCTSWGPVGSAGSKRSSTFLLSYSSHPPRFAYPSSARLTFCSSFRGRLYWNTLPFLDILDIR